MSSKQEDDADLKMLKEWIINKEKPSDESQIAKFSNSLQKYWRYFEHLCVSRKGLVCYKYYSAPSKKFKELILVPEKYQEHLIMNHHDLKSCGHLGPQKILLRIRQKYYFESMTAKVKQYCATCNICSA